MKHLAASILFYSWPSARLSRDNGEQRANIREK